MVLLSRTFLERNAEADAAVEDITTTSALTGEVKRVTGVEATDAVIHAAVEADVGSQSGAAVELDWKRCLRVVVCPTGIPVVNPVVIAISNACLKDERSIVGKTERLLESGVVIPSAGEVVVHECSVSTEGVCGAEEKSGES